MAIVAHYFWIFPALCAVAALGMIGAAGLPVLKAQQALTKKLDALQARTAVPLVDTAQLERSILRLRESGEEVPVLAVRARVAVAAIAKGLNDLRIPEALTAIRVAIAAMRALRSAL